MFMVHITFMLDKGIGELVALDNKHRFHLVHFWILGGYSLNMVWLQKYKFCLEFWKLFLFMCDEKLITTSQLLYVGNNDMYMEV
jgi:hypothetical protein